MNELSNTNYMSFGDVSYDKDIIPLDEKGNPQKLVPMAGILDWFRKKETEPAEITSKVYINGTQSDLSVIKLDAEDYYQKVIAGETDEHTLYVLSSFENNAYGQRIQNVLDPVKADDAATKGYVDEKIAEIRQKASQLSALDEKSATSVKVVKTVNSIISILKNI